MSDDFQQTVDLKLKKESKKLRTKPSSSRTSSTRAQEIDEVYEEKDGGKDLKKIDKYQEPQVNEGVFRKVVIVLGIIIVAVIVYAMLFAGGDKKDEKKIDWYAVKLVTGEIYYGEIENMEANPVVLNNVYYNYNQIKKDGTVDTSFNLDDSKNIRLVKMGKETYGPSGKMLIYQSQINKANELDRESKVLKAIMNYEK